MTKPRNSVKNIAGPTLKVNRRTQVLQPNKLIYMAMFTAMFNCTIPEIVSSVNVRLEFNQPVQHAEMAVNIGIMNRYPPITVSAL